MSATLTKPIPVRLTEEIIQALSEIEDYTGTDKSKLIRLAIKLGMPEVQRRFSAPTPTKKAKS